LPCPALPKNPQKSTHFEKGCIHWFDLTGNSDPSIASQKARPFIIIADITLNQAELLFVQCQT